MGRKEVIFNLGEQGNVEKHRLRWPVHLALRLMAGTVHWPQRVNGEASGDGATTPWWCWVYPAPALFSELGTSETSSPHPNKPHEEPDPIPSIPATLLDWPQPQMSCVLSCQGARGKVPDRLPSWMGAGYGHLGMWRQAGMEQCGHCIVPAAGTPFTALQCRYTLSFSLARLVPETASGDHHHLNCRSPPTCAVWVAP